MGFFLGCGVGIWMDWLRRNGMGSFGVGGKFWIFKL